MQKKDLAKLALLGMGASLLFGACQKQDGSGTGSVSAAEESVPDTQAFLNKLSPEAQQKFQSLDTDHQKMAMKMTTQTCNGKNACKGQGGCKTVEHACAGQNDCKGKGGPPVKDANKAVDIQYNNQTKQRQQMNGTTQPSDQTSPMKPATPPTTQSRY